MKKGVLFDLDGTLIDTIVDLGRTVDKIMLHYGIVSDYTYDDYRYMVGNGAKMLVKRALGDKGVDVDGEMDNIYKMFTELYSTMLFDNAKLYDGIDELIKYLKKEGYLIAVVTNKPEVNAKQIIDHFFAPDTFVCVSGQREGVPVKPDPAQVVYALEKMGITKDEAVFVGDSNTDIETAKNSGIVSIGVDWGFRGHEELEKAGADFIAYKSEDIKNFLKKFKKVSKKC